MTMRRIITAAIIYNLATILVLLAGVRIAQAKPYSDPAWRAAPAYSVAVPSMGGFRAIPSGVCPFGISDYAAYRGKRRLDHWLTLDGPRIIVNGYRTAVRAYVWCG